MAFTVQDFEQLLDMLNQRPEWRMKLREVLLNGDGRSLSVSIDRLTEQVRLLTEQVRALTERMDRLEQRVGGLEQRVDGHDKRFDQIDKRFDQLEQRVDKLEHRVETGFQQVNERIDRLEQHTDERFRQVDERFNQVDRTLQRMNDHIGELRGKSLEGEYREHIGAFFGRFLRRVHTVPINTLEDDERISRQVFIELLNLDILAKGKVDEHPDHPEVWLAIEISTTVKNNDVTRARKRADLLCQAGYPTIAVAGGKDCSRDAATLAQQHNVVLVQDGGQMTGWDVALEQALQSV